MGRRQDRDGRPQSEQAEVIPKSAETHCEQDLGISPLAELEKALEGREFSLDRHRFLLLLRFLLVNLVGFGLLGAAYLQGWVAKARLDRVQRSRESATSQVEYATSKLNLARRDLRLTELKAPYLGTISRKRVDAFTEEKTGQPVYDIEASGALEIRFDIPETTISRVTLGMPVTVTFPTARGGVLQARITEIGSSAGRANAFPIKAGLIEPPPSVRSGMTTEVSILLKQEGTASAYLVPLAAIAPGDRPGQGYVFVFDAATQTVKKNLIKGKGATDNFAHVFEGVKVGDVVAAAGVTFLGDGQKVKLMQRRAATGLGTPANSR